MRGFAASHTGVFSIRIQVDAKWNAVLLASANIRKKLVVVLLGVIRAIAAPNDGERYARAFNLRPIDRPLVRGNVNAKAFSAPNSGAVAAIVRPAAFPPGVPAGIIQSYPVFVPSISNVIAIGESPA